MNTLCTGSSGFLAKAFCKKLQQENITVIPFDLPERNILGINEIIIPEPVHMVVHMAAIANLNESIRDQDNNFQVNIRGTYEVAKFCVKHDIPMIFISTCCVYHSDKYVDETSYPLTNEPYAASKMAGEYILKGMPALKYCILRIGTVYGEGMRKELFNYIALDKALKGETININGNGSQKRTYIYIDDLVDGIYKTCMNFEKCDKEIINLCGSEQISIMDTISVVMALTGNSVNFKRGFTRYGDFQKEDVSTSKAYHLLDWECKTTYREGMEKVYQWLKSSQM
jgi:nucleoside-diphosphate-sugar epimerase